MQARNEHFCKNLVSYARLGFKEEKGVHLELVFEDQSKFVFWQDECSIVETVSLRQPQQRVVADWDGNETDVPSRINLTFCTHELYMKFQEVYQ